MEQNNNRTVPFLEQPLIDNFNLDYNKPDDFLKPEEFNP